LGEELGPDPLQFIKQLGHDEDWKFVLNRDMFSAL
jgi:hypothetical protein